MKSALSVPGFSVKKKPADTRMDTAANG